MTNRLLQQGKGVAWLCDDETGAALVKVVTTEGTLITNYDAVGADLSYVGKAVAGTATSAAVWQIKKLVFNTEGDVTTTFADGNADFDNIWDDRASLTYT